MNVPQRKFKLIFLPFLILSSSVIVGYSFLNWLLFICGQSYPINEEILNFWIPAALPWIPLLIWFRPRLLLLDLRAKSGRDTTFGNLLIAGIAIAVPLMIAQSYLKTATGTLTALSKIEEINQHPVSRYYTLKDFKIDKNHLSAYSVFTTSGRYSEHFDMNIYVVFPMLPQDSSFHAGSISSNPFAKFQQKLSSPVAWYGVRRYKEIQNSLSQEEKEKAYQAFAEECDNEIRNPIVSPLLYHFSYLERLGNSDDNRAFSKAIMKNRFFASAPNIVLTPITDSFEARNGNKLSWIFASYFIGSILVFFTLLRFDFKENEPDESLIEKELFKNNLKAFIPKKETIATSAIAYLNILVFIIMAICGLGVFSFSTDDLVRLGANYGPLTRNNEWWRLFTAMFLHGGIAHIFFNMYALFFVGSFLEPKLGRSLYLLVYFLTGIIASATSIVWNPAVVSVGASGAIFGLFGVILAFFITKKFPKELNNSLLPAILLFVIPTLAMGALQSGIDNAGHVGGLVSGFILGMVIAISIKSNQAPYAAIDQPHYHAKPKFPNLVREQQEEEK